MALTGNDLPTPTDAHRALCHRYGEAGERPMMRALGSYTRYQPRSAREYAQLSEGGLADAHRYGPTG